MEKTEQQRLFLGWHWFWFLPLCVLVLLLIEWHTVVFGLVVLKLAWQRWDWGVLISPSSAFCWGVIALSVVFPFYGLDTIGSLVAAGASSLTVLGSVVSFPIA